MCTVTVVTGVVLVYCKVGGKNTVYLFIPDCNGSHTHTHTQCPLCPAVIQQTDSLQYVVQSSCNYKLCCLNRVAHSPSFLLTCALHCRAANRSEAGSCSLKCGSLSGLRREAKMSDNISAILFLQQTSRRRFRLLLFYSIKVFLFFFQEPVMLANVTGVDVTLLNTRSCFLVQETKSASE